MPQIFNHQCYKKSSPQSIFDRKVNPETVCENRLNMLDTATIVNRKLDLGLIRSGVVDSQYMAP